jgi:sterol desaturase/sphingolipid hydroxylase (fatty acid hydroxylase superfamily)
LLIIIPIAVAALLTILELRQGHRLTRDRLLNCTIWFGRVALAMTLLPLVALTVPWSLVDTRTLPFLAGFAVYFVVMDLGEYLFHRAQHAIPWLWKLHALHHSDADMNATTTERHFWGDQFIKAVTIWPAATLIVRPTAPVLVTYFFLMMWNYATHSALPFSFGRLSWLLNSPAYHRRHHSRLPEHYNSNFAALLPIWDVLSGSYHRPADTIPPTGLEGAPPGPLQLLTWPFTSGRVVDAAHPDYASFSVANQAQ